jgi:hypothetical protein
VLPRIILRQLYIDVPGGDFLRETLNKYGFVFPAKAGTKSNQQAGFPLSRE